MKIKIVFTLLMLSLLIVALPAIDNNSRRAIGLHFGSSTGNGYAMRWMGKEGGLQLTFGAYTSGSSRANMPNYIYEEDLEGSPVTIEEEGRESAANIGLNYMFILDHFRSGRLYMMAGGSYKYFTQKIHTQQYALTPGDSYYHPVDGTEGERTDVEHRWTAGAGPGFELALGKQFRLAFEIPITYNWKNDVVMYIPQVGLYYYFK